MAHFGDAFIEDRAGGSKRVEDTLARRRQHLQPTGKKGQAADLAALTLCEASEHGLFTWVGWELGSMHPGYLKPRVVHEATLHVESCRRDTLSKNSTLPRDHCDRQLMGAVFFPFLFRWRA